jgi:hypothetical protein
MTVSGASLQVYPCFATQSGEETLKKFRYRARRTAVLVALLTHDLHAADEFYKHTARSFKRRIREIERTYDQYSDAEMNRDLGGTTMSELAGEQVQETHMLSEMNGYFGILTVYGAFERFLFWMFQDMKNRGEVTGAASNQGYLTLEGYKDVLKTSGVYLSQPPFKWSELKKLQAIRNVIAHHNGHVIADQEKWVASYGYKAGDSIVIDDSYFQHTIHIVRDTCSMLSKKMDSLPKPTPKKKNTL